MHIYHGKGKLSLAASLARYGVVLTTFNTMALEAPPRPEDLLRRRSTPGGQQAPAAGELGEDRSAPSRQQSSPAGRPPIHTESLPDGCSLPISAFFRRPTVYSVLSFNLLSEDTLQMPLGGAAERF